ncbi:MAG: membrane protein insertase YidC [Mariprofundaceae bacterium]
MNEQRNMLLAFALSMLVLLGWSMIFPAPDPSGEGEGAMYHDAAVEKQETGDAHSRAVSEAIPAAKPGERAGDQATASVAATAGKRFLLRNELVEIEVDDRGWLTKATLRKYRESIDPASPMVSVLGEQGKHRMIVNSGVMGVRQVRPFTPVRWTPTELQLKAELEGGRVWQRTIRLAPDSYLIEIRDRIVGGAGLRLYRQVVERNPDREKNTFYEHVGPIALVNDKLTEVDYDDLDQQGAVRTASVGGWIGIMNRYFIAALLTERGRDYPFYFKGDGRSYQAGLIDDGKAEGADQVFSSSLFVGPKSIPLLKTLDAGLERSVDFGWFAFIAKPLHALLLWLHDHVVPNFGWNIILLVLMIKLLFFWPTQKSYESMAAMRRLQPELVRLKELYGDDRQRMSQEMMALYKKHKVSPFGGCLPIMIQIPVFFALYKVLLMSIEMRQAPFIGWIQDLSVQDPYFVLPVLMGLSMFIQQKLNPQPTDPMQAKVMQFLPPVFTVMFLFFPAGLVLYWLVNNILSIAQQWYVLKVKQAL